ncbi:MAG: hypothetical protein II430_02260 [Selenomonas sp.]|nr:hypothetical protein [Selenomonas sp.]
MQGEELLQEIIKDMETAEKYLISAIADNSRFSRAVAIVEDNISEQGKTLIRARREIEKKKYGNKRHWVIKTQFIYNKLAEEQGLSNTWLSESKIKRDWKNYIFMVSEVAARLEDKPKKKRKKSVKRVASRGDKI